MSELSFILVSSGTDLASLDNWQGWYCTQLDKSDILQQIKLGDTFSNCGYKIPGTIVYQEICKLILKFPGYQVIVNIYIITKTEGIEHVSNLELYCG
jgi:hypothetical protein